MTKIVDDDRILFYRSNGQIYLNSLDRTCLGLSRRGVFSYQVQSGARYVRVCDSDAITVLESAGPGFNCGLGQFVPVSAEVAAELLGPGRSTTRRIESQPVTLPQPEPEPAETQQKE